MFKPDVKLGMTYRQRDLAIDAFTYYLDFMKTNGYGRVDLADIADLTARLSSTDCGDPGCKYCTGTEEA